MDARLLSFKVLLEYEGANRWLKSIRNDHFIRLKPTKIIAERTIVLTNEVMKWQRLLDSIIDSFPGRAERDDWAGQANTLKNK